MSAPREVKRILVVKLRTLGDVLTTFPLLRALKEIYPAARLTFVTDEAYRELVETNPRVDEVWSHPARELRARGPFFALGQQVRTLRKIRKSRFDLFIDLYGSSRTAFWGWAAGIPQRLGFNLRGRKWLYNVRITAACRHVADLNLQFAQTLGWRGGDRSLEFFLAGGDESAARKVLLEKGWNPGVPALVVSPGGGWPVKCWNPEFFGRAAKHLFEATGCQVLISGSAAERRRMETCARAFGGPAVFLENLPLRHLAAVIKHCRLYLGNDSGPKYFAEAFGVPTVICYGPTDFQNNNRDTPLHRVACRPVACRPCHSEICSQPRRACLDDLTVEEVAGLLLSAWEAGGNSAGNFSATGLPETEA